MDTFSTKLQQKALQQPKQKKSKSAEFLMGREERAAVLGIENPAFDGGGSTELSVPPFQPGREIRGDRPDSTLAAHQKKMELQAPAKERGNERAQNYFDPSSAEQTDPRHCGMAGVGAEDELELTILNADENQLYQRMAALLNEDETFMNIPGTLLASRDEEVLEVKAGDPVLQRRLLLHGGGDASGSGPSLAHTIAKTQAVASAGLGAEAGLEAGRMVMGRETTVKMRRAEEVIPHYAQQLRERVRPDMITLGSLSLQQKAAQKRKRKKSEWAKTKERLMASFAGNLQEPHSQSNCDEAMREAPQPRLNTLLQYSRTTESPSLRELGEGKEEAMAKYGQMTELPESSSSTSWPPLQEGKGVFGDEKGEQREREEQRTKWEREKEAAALAVASPAVGGVCCCVASGDEAAMPPCWLKDVMNLQSGAFLPGATRDKLPRGLYIVSVALHSHLGGPALALRNKTGQQQWAAATEPIEHRGRFFDTDLQVNQSLFMILPATCEVVPSMVLVFQLTALPGDSSHVSSVLAWGAFPVCGPSLSLVQGRGSLLEYLGDQSAALPYQYPHPTPLACPNLRSIMTNPKANCHSSPHPRPSSVLIPFIPSYIPNSSRVRAPAAEQESLLWYILTGGLLSTCQLILPALPHLCQSVEAGKVRLRDCGRQR
ncbi:hypothetical protein FQN60_013860 [Etheostoma spectabile]|uniref:Uncharacterized protein n=1 Tax=Etheostoma spectabile TaxID=54343 RepID=A0A5J5CGA5_9PERO|nr:hypothetical protein FQN60_013860 [Etheostoma spectabile]